MRGSFNWIINIVHFLGSAGRLSVMVGYMTNSYALSILLWLKFMCKLGP